MEVLETLMKVLAAVKLDQIETHLHMQVVEALEALEVVLELMQLDQVFLLELQELHCQIV